MTEPFRPSPALAEAIELVRQSREELEEVARHLRLEAEIAELRARVAALEQRVAPEGG